MSKCPRFNNMYGIKKLLALDLDGKLGMRTKNQDRVVVVTGNEGKGKSNLLLGMNDYWYVDLLKVKNYGEEFIKYFGANKKEFVWALANAPKYYFITHDESLKDLYARDAISTFNKDLNKAYFVIRGKNLFTALACPSILDLDPNFRKRRVSGMYHVYSAGKVAYYGRKKLNKLIPALMKMSIYNARPDPKYAKDDYGKLIRPDFTDTFPLYNGPLLPAYLKRKDSNMEGTVKELLDKYGSDEEAQTKKKKGPKSQAEELLPKYRVLLESGLGTKEIAKRMDISYHVASICKRLVLQEQKEGLIL
jgi:hypothetical protein